MALFSRIGEGKRLFSDTLDYVNDYRSELITDNRGKIKEKLIYIGPWFVLRGKEECNLALMLASAFCCLLTICSLAMLQFTGGYESVCWLVALPQAIALFPGLYAILAVAELPFRGKPMRRDKYMHSVIRACRACTAIAVIELVSLLAGLIFRIKDSLWFYRTEDIIHTALTIAALILSIAVIFILQRLEISSVPNNRYSE